MIKERIIDREYMLELDEEVKKGNIYLFHQLGIDLLRVYFVKILYS